MHEHNDPKVAAPQEQAETPEPQTDNSAGSIGDQVLDILSGVEEQFKRLRHVQQGHDAELSSLREHAKALEGAEQEAREELGRLREQRVAVERERHDVQVQVGELEKQTQQIQTQMDEIQQSRSELKSQREELDSERSDLESGRNELAQSRSKLDEDAVHRQQEQQRRQDELQAIEDELSRDRETQAKEQDRLEQQRNNIEQKHEKRRQELDERGAELEQAWGEVEKSREAVNAKLEDSRQLEEQAAAERAQLDQQRDQIESDRQALEQQVQDGRKALEEIQARTEELETRSAEQVEAAEAETKASQAACQEAQADTQRLREETEGLHTQLNDSQAKLSDAEEKLALAGNRLTKFATILSEQAPQLEKGTAALTMVEHQRNQIDRLTKQLAQASVGGSVEEIKRKDERIAELTEALRQARGQTAGDQDVATLESQIAELLQRNDQLRVENEQAKVSVAQAKTELDSSVENAVRDGVNEAAMAEEQARNAELLTELKKVQQSHQQQEKKTERQIATLQERIRDLSAALQEARETATEGGDGKADEAMAQLREKARRVNAVAEHLRQRHARLKKMRQLLADQHRPHDGTAGQETGNLEQRAADIRQLDSQRKQLIEVQAMLESSERTMIRKWARPRAIGAVVWLLILVSINGAIAWFATNHFFPATVSATVSMEAQTRGGVELDEAQADSWIAWHQNLINSESFDNAVGKRMAERRIDDYKTGPAVHKRLNDKLNFERTGMESFNLTLDGRDRDELTSVLDVVGLTLAAESTRQMGKRNDRARAVLENERQESGLTRYAAVNPVAISDERMFYLGPVFGVLMAISLLLILGFYNHLLRAKRVFDEESALIDSGEPVTQE
jgi:hypothetical protein